MTALLQARDLSVSFRYGTRTSQVVRDVSLDIAERSVLAVLGESGSGKTMLARSLIGLEPAGAEVRGSVEFAGRPTRPARPAARRKLLGREIGLVSQDPAASLDAMRTVGAQLAEVLRRHERLDRRTRRDEAVRRLEQVHIRHPEQVVRKYPSELSGGMRQRVSIALALCGRPRLLVADEPSSALDAIVGARVVDLLDELRRTTGTSIVFVTHDIAVAARIAHEPQDRVAVMLHGRFVEHGPAAEVLVRPRHAYTASLLAGEPSAAIPRGELATVPRELRDADWGPLRQVADNHWVCEEAA
ncbi:ABC transporter ATP-binding protein [Dactylosporangium sp. AC04546]|uniref:ABC transporter ATP-binding protein n=1 Tax=Dactylosporangium sp. AC04546 TaxID=2862460 RepID=UPI001EDEBF33|nr:ABC transporter ATP-binding protein [Dactylosporangium sp. AC04546]WVK89026.1 ABC transporter ATP-binding protein [Dactylosporangium sp. AC04546]